VHVGIGVWVLNRWVVVTWVLDASVAVWVKDIRHAENNSTSLDTLLTVLVTSPNAVGSWGTPEVTDNRILRL
jgi:hypothetical protein